MDQSGHAAGTPLALPLPAWKSVLSRVWRESAEDNMALVAAGVSFYGFLALAPMLAALILIYGLFADPQTALKDMQSLMRIMPADAATLIGDQLVNAVKGSDGKKGIAVILALTIALFGARNGAGSILTALNLAYDEKEKRSWLSVNLTALVITAVALAGALAALAAMSALALLDELMPRLPDAIVTAGQFLAFLLLTLIATFGITTLYRFGPSRQKPKWRWALPGAVLTAVLCLALTAGFGFYVANFGKYDVTYGSLGTVMVLLTWMYLSTYVFLFGAELNSELEHQTALDTTTGHPLPLGERGAWVADNVADMPEPVPDQPLPAPAPISLSEEFEEEVVSHARVYVTARASAWLSRRLGLKNVGMVSSALATLGLGLIRKRGKTLQGLAILGAASGLAVLGRPSVEGTPPEP